MPASLPPAQKKARRALHVLTTADNGAVAGQERGNQPSSAIYKPLGGKLDKVRGNLNRNLGSGSV
jgi:hypothetical protein